MRNQMKRVTMSSLMNLSLKQRRDNQLKQQMIVTKKDSFQKRTLH